jgi:hypothetical protein
LSYRSIKTVPVFLKHPFQSLLQVPQQMPPVSYLDRIGRTSIDAINVSRCSVAADNLYTWVC